MKKIPFNDRFGLTKLVVDELKTQTRRIVPNGTPLGNWTETVAYARFKVGEIVAIAQSYEDLLFEDYLPLAVENKILSLVPANHPGISNKMFVRAELMPYHIRITKIRVERLQDISREDCLKEGVVYKDGRYYVQDNGNNGVWNEFDHARDAYAFLIDKVSGKGTWGSNPWVFVYDFKLEE